MNNQPSHITVSKPIFFGLVALVVFFGICVVYLLAQRPRVAPATQSQVTVTPQPTAETAQNLFPTQAEGNAIEGTTPGATSPTIVPTTPVEVTKAFYVWYVTYKGNPLRSGAYQQQQLLTTNFKTIVADLLRVEPTNSPHDPLLCSENKSDPNSVIYEDPIYLRNKARVKIRRLDGKYLYTSILVQEHGKWLIDDITCSS